MDKWLVYDGMRKYGKEEQRMAGLFLVFSTADRLLTRKQLKTIVKVGLQLAGQPLDKANVDLIMNVLMKPDGVCSNKAKQCFKRT